MHKPLIIECLLQTINVTNIGEQIIYVTKLLKAAY